MNALRLAMLAAKTPQKQTAEVSKSIGFHQQIYIYIYHYNAIIYLENHKEKMFCPYGFGHVFCPLRVFSKYIDKQINIYIYITGHAGRFAGVV